MILSFVLFVFGGFAIFMIWHEIIKPIPIPAPQQTTWYFPGGGRLVYNLVTGEVETIRLEPYDRHYHPDQWIRTTEYGENWITKYLEPPSIFRVGDYWYNDTYRLNSDGTVTWIDHQCKW